MIDNKLRECLKEIEKGAFPCWLYGLTKEAKSYLISLLKNRIKGSFLLITPTHSEASEVYQDLLTFLSREKEVFLLPSREKDSGGRRLKILHQIREKSNILLVTSLSVVVQKAPPLSTLVREAVSIRKGDEVNRDNLLHQLTQKGYKFSPLVEEEGDYSFRGGIIDFYSPLYSHPIRIELFGEGVESVREFDPSTQSSTKRRKEVIISSRDELSLIKREREALLPFPEVFSSFIYILNEPMDLQNQMKDWESSEIQVFKSLLKKPHLYLSALPQRTSWMRPKRAFSLSSSSLPSYQGHLDLVVQDIKKWKEKGYRVITLVSNWGQGERLREIFEEKKLEAFLEKDFSSPKGLPSLLISLGDLRKGFQFKNTKEVFITDEDIFERYKERRKRWVYPAEREKIKKWTELQEGDYVVHLDYGIGIFKGIRTLKVEGRKCDYFQVNYKEADRLYIPIDQLDRLHKYIGDSDYPPPIYSLEGGRWRWTKRKARKAAQELAFSLLKLYSTRKVISGHSFSPDTEWQLEFESSFPYRETLDQLRAVQETKKDMESSNPMDRLICGDAGYGKTEVAMRAAFKSVMEGKQVAILVPTTILAEQHYRTFTERMAGYPIYIEMLSRFQRPQKQREIIANSKQGKIDIVTGTHRLLQKDVDFKDLGLIIIDEEQRFGVVQKKRLREFKKSVDVLSLSATPIPRSLYMSLTGIREMSMIFTPPEERLNVETQVAEYSKSLIRKAIYKELERGGQVFYLYNRIERIYEVAERIKQMVPEASVAVSHGRVPPGELEKITKNFLERKYDILVCTTIIESGIDMPNVNTLIVEKAERFGLADLYQLRGRVGRGNIRGYAYFLFTPTKFLTKEARKRLKTVSEFREGGSGFRIAMQDLQIRGAGNLLGREQHGHISAVGFTLYSQLLSEEIKRAKGEKVIHHLPVNLDLGIEARIPPSFVPYKEQRFDLYRKIGEIKREKEILNLKEELRDRYGPLPMEVINLIKFLEIKLIARDLGIISLSRRNSRVWATFSSPILSKEKREAIRNHLKLEVHPLPLDEKNLVIIP
ncbi:MAG: transcription-repair coupling factor, partial [Candidatus Aerophobetes bacterium]|nr:transcription-repair coupling factor [Candidatus Aerophobetes bacterium]